MGVAAVGALVQVDAAVQRVAQACRERSEVAAAYLFGSALGPRRPDSDLDVGLVLTPAPVGTDAHARFRRGLRIEGEVEAALGALGTHPFHVTTLEGDRPLFTLPVLREGRLRCLNDVDATTDFIEWVARGYAENAPRHRAALREVLEDAIPGGTRP